jgi:RHS repeat-associated protein
VTYRSRGGRIEEVVDAAGASTRFEHDHEGRVVRIVSALGAESIAYDGGGRVASRTDAAGRTTRFEYDANGDLITRVAPDGGVWRYTYDAKRNPTGRTSPAGRRSSTVWDDRGLIVSNTDEHGGTWRYEHDALGNLIAATTPAGATSRIEYDAAGLRALRAIDPTGAVTAVEYDENDRVLRTVYPDGSETRALYDCCTAVGLTDESGSTAGIDRDAMMRPVAYSGKAGVTKLTYDRSGLVVAAGLDDTTLARFEYDAAGRQVRTTYTDGSYQETSYDTAGRLARVRTPRGYSVELQRDAASNVVRVADSLGSVTECGFDVSDRLVWSRNARGHVMQVTYDADGLPVSKTANGVQVAAFGYTAGGVLESVTGDGGARYTLDPCGRISRTVWDDGTEATFELDSRGNIASMGLPGAEIVYGYDARGRITSVEFSGERVDWRYTGAGDVLAEERSNGVASEYGWSGHEMTRARHAKGETPVYDVRWTLDRRGRATASEGVFSVGPAPVERERLTRDGSGRVTAVGAGACSYDADGNVIARAAAYEAEHDPENRAVLVSEGGASVRYSYDAFGHRARREDRAGATLYHRDGAGRVLFETDGAGAVTAYHVWRGPVLVASVVDGKPRFYHGDRVMNVVAVTDARGKVVAAYDYDPFGAVSASSGTAKEQPFRFAGMAGATAEPAGLYLMGFRLYDPAMGQFLEKDPAGSRGTIEPYDYCAGDPVNRFDPKGLEGYTTSTYSNETYGGGWRPGNSVEGTRPNQYTPPYYEPPKGPPPYTPAPGSDKIFAGVGNGILGTVGTIKYGTVLWGAWNAGTLLTPWGWGWRAALLLGSLGRLYYSYKYVKEGSNGESFPAGTDPVIQTVDPSGIRTWPGKAWDSICSIPSGLRNAADRLGQSIDQINRPWAYNPEFGMDDE